MARVTRPYAYSCSGGDHAVLSSPEPMETCPVFIEGQPCQGTLRQTAGPRRRS